MNPDTVYVKTEKGKQRFEARDIPMALRHALILVDGHSTLEQLMRKGEGLENLADSYEMLSDMGLIAPAGTAAAPSAVSAPSESGGAANDVKQQLSGLATRILGDKAEKIIHKIGESDSSNGALLQTVETCGKVIKLTIDEKKAQEFVVAAKDVIAKHG